MYSIQCKTNVPSCCHRSTAFAGAAHLLGCDVYLLVCNVHSPASDVHLLVDAKHTKHLPSLKLGQAACKWCTVQADNLWGTFVLHYKLSHCIFMYVSFIHWINRQLVWNNKCWFIMYVAEYSSSHILVYSPLMHTVSNHKVGCKAYHSSKGCLRVNIILKTSRKC